MLGSIVVMTVMSKYLQRGCDELDLGDSYSPLFALSIFLGSLKDLACPCNRNYGIVQKDKIGIHVNSSFSLF